MDYILFFNINGSNSEIITVNDKISGLVENAAGRIMRLGIETSGTVGTNASGFVFVDSGLSSGQFTGAVNCFITCQWGSAFGGGPGGPLQSWGLGDPGTGWSGYEGKLVAPVCDSGCNTCTKAFSAAARAAQYARTPCTSCEEVICCVFEKETR